MGRGGGGGEEGRETERERQKCYRIGKCPTRWRKRTVRAARDDGASHPVDDLGDADAREGEGAAHLLGGPLDLDLVALAGRRQVAHVDVDGHARLRPQVPGGNSHAPHPVGDGGRHGAVDAAPGVEVVPRERQPRLDGALGREHDPHVGEQEVVDGRVGQHSAHEVLDV